jgi:membrane associated rhomboid family serine protease
MTKPQRFLMRMILFVTAVGVVGAMLYLPLREAFLANAPLNGLILGVLLLGIVYNFRQVGMIYPEVAWIESFQENRQAISQSKQPQLLAPMATMLGEKKSTLKLSTLSMRSLLDGIASRLDESRELSRYTIGLLIFLGLLGTFWGLLETVGSISDVIGGLTVTGGDMNAMFQELKTGLEAPLAGMGTAFSSSLFGLAGSLVLGFLDLQAAQAQNRFYNDLEDWLSEITHLSSGSLGSDGDQSVPAYVQALLEQTAESLENLQRTMAKGEESRSASARGSAELTDKLSLLTDHLAAQHQILVKLAESVSGQSGGMDQATQNHIRNLDLYMARLIEEMVKGREDTVQQLRSEIKLLARTIAALPDNTGR